MAMGRSECEVCGSGGHGDEGVAKEKDGVGVVKRTMKDGIGVAIEMRE